MGILNQDARDNLVEARSRWRDVMEKVAAVSGSLDEMLAADQPVEFMAGLIGVTAAYRGVANDCERFLTAIRTAVDGIDPEDVVRQLRERGALGD